MNLGRWSRITAAWWSGLSLLVSGPAFADDVAAIAKTLSRQFDKPGLAVEATPIVAKAGWAIADWTQGQRGGRALLTLRKGQWEVVLCGGDGLRSMEGLEASGVPLPVARHLAKELAILERQVSATRLKAMGRFSPEAAGSTHPHPDALSHREH